MLIKTDNGRQVANISTIFLDHTSKIKYCKEDRTVSTRFINLSLSIIQLKILKPGKFLNLKKFREFIFSFTYNGSA